MYMIIEVRVDWFYHILITYRNDFLSFYSEDFLSSRFLYLVFFYRTFNENVNVYKLTLLGILFFSFVNLDQRCDVFMFHHL